MLVLSRKLNETIVINGDIRIMVVAIRGNQVRLGIEAPDSVGIFREELGGGTGLSEHSPRLDTDGMVNTYGAVGATQTPLERGGTPRSVRRQTQINSSTWSISDAASHPDRNRRNR
jgi:carbon storage regulator